MIRCGRRKPAENYAVARYKQRVQRCAEAVAARRPVLYLRVACEIRVPAYRRSTVAHVGACCRANNQGTRTGTVRARTRNLDDEDIPSVCRSPVAGKYREPAVSAYVRPRLVPVVSVYRVQVRQSP